MHFIKPSSLQCFYYSVLNTNAEYICMGDVIINVPGGSNNHNYDNITLIVKLACLYGVYTIWDGLGHMSENPILPDILALLDLPIKFICPTGPPMHALGIREGALLSPR